MIIARRNLLSANYYVIIARRNLLFANYYVIIARRNLLFANYYMIIARRNLLFINYDFIIRSPDLLSTNYDFIIRYFLTNSIKIQTFNKDLKTLFSVFSSVRTKDISSLHLICFQITNHHIILFIFFYDTKT